MLSSRKRNQSLHQLASTSNANWKQFATERKISKVILPTIAERREAERMQAKELSIKINKLKTMLNKVDMNPQDVIRQIYYVIKNFGEVESNFREVFAGSHSRLKDYLFISQSQICQDYRIKEGTTYKVAIRKVDKINKDDIESLKSIIAELETKLASLDGKYRSQINQQQIEIAQLRVQLERYKQLSNTEYVVSLERKVADLKQTIANMQDQYKELVKKNEQISQELLQTRQMYENQQQKCSDLQAKVYDLNVDKEQLEVCMLKIKDRFQQISGKMEGMKDIIQKVQAQNQNLVAERIKLVNRAAISFQQLTPRPKYQEYFTHDPQLFLKPTSEIFDALFNEMPAEKRQDFSQKYFLSKKNRKLMQCEAIRQQTIDEASRNIARINHLTNESNV